MHKRTKFIHSAKRRAKRAERRERLLNLRHHPFVVPVLTFLVLFFVSLVAFVAFNGRTVTASDSHIVIFNNNKNVETLPTRAGTVGDLLKRLNITLNEGDVVEPTVDTPIVEDNFRVNLYRARPVTVVDGNHKMFSLSAASTPRSVAQQVGVSLYPEDQVSEAPSDDFLRDGITAKVTIKRATPLILNVYGTAVQVRTQASQVSDLLKEKNIHLAEGDSVRPALDTTITANQQVFILRKGTQLLTEEQTVAMPVHVVKDGNLSFGTTVVRQQGSDGKKLVTYIAKADGSRQVVQEVTIQAPVIQIVAEGTFVDIPTDKTDIMSAAGLSESDYSYANYIISRESGWCATKWQGEYGNCPAYHGAPSYGGYGLCQATPPGKMSTAGGDWATNPVTQMRWCSGYAHSRYGGWAAAANHWQVYHNW